MLPLSTQGTVAAIILAAGTSSRMGAGRHKLLLPLGGRPVLLHVIETVLASQARPIIIVVGHQAPQVRTVLEAYTHAPDIQVVENADYLHGMSTSLRTGIRTLLSYHTNTGNITPVNASPVRPIAALVVLGDQPLISSELLDRLIATYMTGEKKIVAPRYEGRRGNPVLFDASFFPELMEVSGDEGGRSVIQRHSQNVSTIEVDDIKASYDVDTWDTYQQVAREWEQGQQEKG